MGVQEKFLNNYMSIKFPIISIDYYQVKRRSSENIRIKYRNIVSYQCNNRATKDYSTLSFN